MELQSLFMQKTKVFKAVLEFSFLIGDVLFITAMNVITG